MKFKFNAIVYFILAFVFVVVVANVKVKEEIPNLVLENVEALTNEEITETNKSEICYNSITYDENESRIGIIYYCGGCSEVPYTSYKDQGICKVKKQK